jgi:predicted enzyme related to lactoylglutathione lyase
MATMTSYPNGHLCWVDLMSRERASASAFYCSLFGWEADDQDTDAGPPYTIFTLDGQQVAGLGEMSAAMQASGMPPVWNSYINVDDVDAAAVKAGRLGATVVMPPMDVMEAGRMAVIQDPTGAFISFWQPIGHRGAQLVNVPNTWVWNELYTSDPETALAFFRDLFGWTFEKQAESPHDYWVHSTGKRMNGGLMRKPPEMEQVPSHWNVYFHAADLTATIERLKELGGGVCAPPFDVSVGKIAVVTDPQGAAFCLIQMFVPVDE